jgi:hypothetical protein
MSGGHIGSPVGISGISNGNVFVIDDIVVVILQRLLVNPIFSY